MASNYPGSLDSFDTIASDKKTSDSVGGRTHRQMHNDLGDAIEAVQGELGTDPAGTFSTVKARLDALVAYAAKTSAYTATVADHTLNVTSGTFTLDLPAASTCTGQSLRVKNSGTGVVTLDGNSSETVEGVATFPLGPGSYVEITSTGSAWILTGGVPDTGWRAIASWTSGGVVTGTMPTGFVPRTGVAGYITLRRAGSKVSFEVVAIQLDASNPVIDSANIAGFRCRAEHDLVLRTYNGSAWTLTYAGTAGTSQWTITGSAGHFTFRNEWSWATSDAWPASLPGTAV